jgi:glycyl-tRNA synthetase alpha subunit
MNYVLQKDNLKFTAAIIAVGVVMAEITYTTYKVSNFNSEVDAKLDRNNKKFDQANAKFDVKFDQVNAKFDQVNAKFDQVNAKFDQLNSKFDAKFDQTRENVNSQFAGLRNDLISIMAFTASHRLEEALDRSENRSNSLKLPQSSLVNSDNQKSMLPSGPPPSS